MKNKCDFFRTAMQQLTRCKLTERVARFLYDSCASCCELWLWLDFSDRRWWGGSGIRWTIRKSFSTLLPAILVVSFGRSVIIAELWRPEIARPGNLLRNFCASLEKLPRYDKMFKILFRKLSPPLRFTLLCSNFVKKLSKLSMLRGSRRTREHRQIAP